MMYMKINNATYVEELGVDCRIIDKFRTLVKKMTTFVYYLNNKPIHQSPFSHLYDISKIL